MIGQRQRMRVVPEPIDQHAVYGNCQVRTAILAARPLLEQQDEARADALAQRRKRYLHGDRKGWRAVDGAGDIADHRSR